MRVTGLGRQLQRLFEQRAQLRRDRQLADVDSTALVSGTTTVARSTLLLWSAAATRHVPRSSGHATVDEREVFTERPGGESRKDGARFCSVVAVTWLSSCRLKVTWASGGPQREPAPLDALERPPRGEL